MSEELAFRELEYHYDIIRAFEKSESDSILTELIYDIRFPETGSIFPLAWVNSAGTIFKYKRNYDYLIDTIWVSGYMGTKQRLWIDNEVSMVYERPISTTSCTAKLDFGKNSRLLVPRGSYFTLSIISNFVGSSRMYCYGAAVYGKKLVDDPLYLKKDIWEDILVEKIVDLAVFHPQAETIVYYNFTYDVILDYMTFLLLYQHTSYPELGPHFVNPYCADIYIDDVHMVRFNGYRSLKFDPGDMLIKRGSELKVQCWHGITNRYRPHCFIDIFGRKLI